MKNSYLQPTRTFQSKWLWENYPEVLSMLLLDHTTHKNIIWATDSYEKKGEGFTFYEEITPNKIIAENEGLVVPRVLKSKEEQSRRIKDKAEVFTPSWVCNAQNNLIDEAWFNRPDVFNKEETLENGSHIWIRTERAIEFSEEKGKTWKDYVRDTRLEITCGEAPYLTSRYDAVSGELIEIPNRIGLLDRKLRVVSENTDNSEDWLYWARIALQNIYGYEMQGDNLFLARNELMLTTIENYYYKFNKIMPSKSIKGISYIISWNLWQMDGLKYVIPGSCYRQPIANLNMFEELMDTEPQYQECKACKTGKGEHIGIKARIRDWKAFHEYGHKDKSKTDIPFIQLVNKSK